MKPFLLIFIVLFSIATQAQTDESLPTDLRKLYIAFDDIDIEKLSDMLCHTGERTETYNALDAYFQADDQKFRFVNTNAKFESSPIVRTNGSLTTNVTFKNVIRITYFTPIDQDTIQRDLQQRFEAQSIKYDPARNAFLIIYTAKLIARKEDGGSWRFAFADNTLPKNISEGCFQ